MQTVVTSPPYWGLRDYGTGTWKGGDPDCGHLKDDLIKQGIVKHLKSSLGGRPRPGTDGSKTQGTYLRVCKKCGAVRTDEQIGNEKTPEEFVAKMVEVFREVRRVLRDDGTLWLNLGDTYGDGKCGRTGTDRMSVDGFSGSRDKKPEFVRTGKSPLPSGNLVCIPWRAALALQADGWVLRQDIIWHKPSPMPESVKNRCTKAHEYLFLLTKSNKYFYNAEAVKEKSIDPESIEGRGARNQDKFVQAGIKCEYRLGFSKIEQGKLYLTRNKRSVWTIPSFGYSGAHFATFPEKLVEPCILAGTSERGACAKCGAPWVRITDVEKLTRERPNDYVKYASTAHEAIDKSLRRSGVNSCANSVDGVRVKTVGWRPTCECFGRLVKKRKNIAGYKDGKESIRWTTVVEYVPRIPLEDHPIVPCVVMDPFVGSGTVCAVAVAKGRRSIGIDLSEAYLRNNAIPRIKGVLMRTPKTAMLAGRKVKRPKLAGKTKTMRPKKGLG